LVYSNHTDKSALGERHIICRGLYTIYFQTDDAELLAASWFHSKDEDEESCEADCKEPPKPTPCENQEQAEDMCSQLKDKDGPLKVKL